MFDELLESNRRYVKTFSLGHLQPVAARGFGLVSCMDTRIEPLVMLGLVPGDAKIMRNAGGRVTSDVLRSLALASTYLGVRDIAVMHHTKCALAGSDDTQLRAAMTPVQLEALAGEDLMGMPDPDAALAADVARLRAFRGLAGGVKVEGWRYDVETGEVKRIIPAAPGSGSAS